MARLIQLITSFFMPKKEAGPATGLFDNLPAEATAQKPLLEQLAAEVIAKTWSEKITDLPAYQAIRALASGQGQLVLALATNLRRAYERDWTLGYSMYETLNALLRGTLDLDEDEYLRIFKGFGLDFDTKNNYDQGEIFRIYPVGLTLAQVARLAKKGPLSPAMQHYLRQLLAGASENYSNAAKIRGKIQEILNLGAAPDALPTVTFTNDDLFGQHLNQFVAGLSPTAASTKTWLQLLLLWQKTSGGQPTAKLRKELAAATAALGPDALRSQGRALLEALASVKPEEKTYLYGNDETYPYTAWHYLLETSLNVAKGLIWTLQPLADEQLLQLLADFAVRCYRKIPGRGPLAPSLGNACLLVLSQSGLPGVAHLSRLRPKIRQSNTLALITQYVSQASQALGVTTNEIEDMAVPTCGLHHDQAEFTYGDYHAVLHLHHGKAEVSWQKDGKPLKAAPTALKKTHPAELKELKNLQTQAQQTFGTQRDRLDRSFIENRRLPWPWFQQYYVEHGLLNTLTRQLIWRFHNPDGSYADAMWLDEAWRNAQLQALPTLAPDTQVQLWHPVLAATAEVLAWRELLEQRQLRQPLKQAFREVYLLTPPEERTATYSNRMAAHILKQHQFNSLAKLRGWSYHLLGAYDKGYESETAAIELPAFGMRAEFWVSEVNADDAFNDTGIWLYVSTDQVRFARGSEAVPLPEVPPVAFSEVMRDVDLFVGVASVANDPAWRDNGGLPAYRNYWESYSFGELGEVAKNRKLALERLVPRLKIAKVSEIKDKFLVVKGKVRTYKIHLGSGNILMEPNDQYLCIVPDRSVKTMGVADVFLPFEGDAVLSIILSKALLLMDDDKITDTTILRQIAP